MEEGLWGAVNNNSKRWCVNKSHKLSDPPMMKNKALHGKLKKALADRIVGSLYVEFDHYKTIVTWSTMEVMYKFPCNQNLIKNVATPNKSPLLRIEKSGKKGIHPINYGPGTSLVQDRAQVDWSMVSILEASCLFRIRVIKVCFSIAMLPLEKNYYTIATTSCLMMH